MLKRHRDRAQCAWNLSLVIDMQPRLPARRAWPIFIEADGKTHAVRLAMGDAVLYSGTSQWHWREAQPRGHRTTVCLYHFVPEDFAGSLE